MKEVFDFYDPTSLKAYNLDKTMQYQLIKLILNVREDIVL